MKKIYDYVVSVHHTLKKLVMVLKIAILIVLATVTNVFGINTYSQTAKVTLDMENKTLEQVMDEIEKQSEFYFIFNQKQIDVHREVNIQAKNKLIDEILSDLFSGTNINYEVLDRKILLSTEKLDENSLAHKLGASDQQRKISGKVVDKSGNPIAGVSVVVMGTNTGIITDMDGNFSLILPEKAKMLMFSFIGMNPREVPIGDQLAYYVTLEEANIGLDEVVVVGYGSQKKVSLSGSITTIRSEELSTIPMPSISQTLMGRSPGLFIKNVNSQPGDASAISMNIRGFGDPLIILDGVPSSSNEFQQLDPNDIESFSVLKDASAASVYGARAGNGVILVTTKRGAVSKAKVTISSVTQWQHFLVTPDWVNSEQYARMENLSRYNEGLTPLWTDEQIQKFADGSEPNKFANVDWWKETIRPFAPQTQQNINIQGGTEKVKYFISGGYFYQEALRKVNDTKNKKYNLRSNIDIALTDKLNMSLDLSVLYQDFFGPIRELERTSKGNGVMTYLFRTRPYFNLNFPDLTKLPDRAPTIYTADNAGYKDWNRLTGDGKISFSYDLPLGIKAKANFHFNREYYNNKEKTTKKPTYNYDWNTGIYNLVSSTQPEQTIYNYGSNSNRIDQQYFLTWNKKFADHNFGAMIVYELLSDNNQWFEASRRRYDFDVDYLFAGPDLDKTNNGSASEGGREGIISRMNYDYKGKYLVELSARNDASAKFPQETRWGFFPSASLAWRISEEGFIKNSLPFIANLKLRASYGKLGYDDTGNFQYLATYSITSVNIYDGPANIVEKGIRSDAIPNTLITWEKMSTSNVGLDFNLWRNKLEGSFDYFYRLRSDVLGTRIQSLPNTVGAPMPQVNYAKYDNRGWEFSLNHINRIAGIEYSIGGNIAWNREKTVFVDQAVFTNDEARRRGNKIGEWTDNFWAYKTDGLFSTKEEINNWADQDGKNNATILPGDLKYVDYNEDGKITSDDQIIIGRGSFPKLMYGINTSILWKGIDFAMLWQGAGQYDYNLRNAPDYSIVFYAGDTPMTYMLTDAYVPENPWLPTNTTNPSFPRYRGDSGNRAHPNFSMNNSYWLVNGAYIRLKNIELGYSLPAKLVGKWGIEKFKFYVAGYNILTFSAVDFMDPEVDTGSAVTFGDYYPPVGTYNIGLLLQF